MYELDLKKAEEPQIKLPTTVGSQQKQGSPGKISTSASLTMLKSLTLQITTNCGKFLKTWEYQNTLLVGEMTAMVQLFEHSLALPFFGTGMKTDLFQSCGHC